MKQEPSGVLATTKMKGCVLFFGLWGVLGGCVSIESPYSSDQTGLEFECATGDVTPHEATVWLKTTEPQDVTVQYTTDPLWSTFQETLSVPTTPEQDFTAHIPLTNLTPKTRYVYRSLVPGKRPGRSCRFVTAPLAEDSATVTFVIGGDTRHSFQPFSIMEAMRQANPDFFVFLGDTIYGDKETPARELSDYWNKYVENRDGFAERLLAETSVYVMWDDHEVDSDFISTNPLMPVGRQAFLDYWPIRRQAQDPTRLYRAFRWGKAVELFLLDTRQYRNPAANTMLGEAQKRWLLTQLAASSASFKFIVSSVPFSDPRIDKWGEYSEERDEILEFISKKGITGVLFLAGDVHHAAMSRVSGFTDRKEFIFGPLAAPMNYKISNREPRFEYFNDDYRNFGKITVQQDELKSSVQVEWFATNNALLHRVILEDNRDSPLSSQ
ncbi:MAG: alkaline phosphatase D family protein [Nitrospirota bacterium]|nr:alkaline phosphatase D family protein [Nitrospirota bacterium]